MHRKRLIARFRIKHSSRYFIRLDSVTLINRFALIFSTNINSCASPVYIEREIHESQHAALHCISCICIWGPNLVINILEDVRAATVAKSTADSTDYDVLHCSRNLFLAFDDIVCTTHTSFDKADKIMLTLVPLQVLMLEVPESPVACYLNMCWLSSMRIILLHLLRYYKRVFCQCLAAVIGHVMFPGCPLLVPSFVLC